MVHSDAPAIDNGCKLAQVQNAAALRAAQNGTAANPLGRRRSIPKEVDILIKTVVQQRVWSKNKFVENDKAPGQLAKKVLKASIAHI